MSSSSVSEAKQKINAAAEHSDKVGEAVGAATDSLAEAKRLVTEAAGDVGHELIQDSLQKFKDAADSLAEGAKLAKEAQEAAQAYAEAIG